MIRYENTEDVLLLLLCVVFVLFGLPVLFSCCGRLYSGVSEWRKWRAHKDTRMNSHEFGEGPIKRKAYVQDPERWATPLNILYIMINVNKIFFSFFLKKSCTFLFKNLVSNLYFLQQWEMFWSLLISQLMHDKYLK